MDARAIVADAAGTVEVREVTMPEPGPRDVVVRTTCSGVSMGTERNLVRGEVNWGPFPICPGYQAVGEVESVGESVERFAPGEAVYYRDSRAGELADGTSVAATNGTHCSRAVVDLDATAGIDHLPGGVDPAPASTFVLPSVGINGVDMAEVGVRDTVVVQGVGLVGLGVVAFCHRRGATVVATDRRPERLDAAADIGADHAVNVERTDAAATVEDLTDGEGADVVFEATGIPELVDDALELVRSRGTFVFQGDYGDRDVSFYFRTPHHNETTARFPCGDGGPPCRNAFLGQVASGALDWGRVVEEIAPSEVPAFYDAFVAGENPGALGATVRWR